VLTLTKRLDTDFAFPSRTLYPDNGDKRQLKPKMLPGESMTDTSEGGIHE
jgi:hypothetical protein